MYGHPPCLFPASELNCFWLVAASSDLWPSILSSLGRQSVGQVALRVWPGRQTFLHRVIFQAEQPGSGDEGGAGPFRAGQCFFGGKFEHSHLCGNGRYHVWALLSVGDIRLGQSARALLSSYSFTTGSRRNQPVPSTIRDSPKRQKKFLEFKGTETKTLPACENQFSALIFLVAVSETQPLSLGLNHFFVAMSLCPRHKRHHRSNWEKKTGCEWLRSPILTH